jgi:hypothetical protein
VLAKDTSSAYILPKGALMFEVPVDKQESKLEYERIGISVLVLLLIAGAAFYFLLKQSAR